ncbi:sulfurtransferase [uncultured Lutibacter sp.]|uniref:sulfurtransferase n=1 Tax=uncultured Lutibacter sp. TaxID=437739 RepID=UPI00261F49B5|nr:sulfurtransferase [uncultured Lutibacter sp.]
MKIEPLVSVAWLFKNIENPNLIILDASPKENKSNLIPKYTDIRIKGARMFDMETTFLDKKSAIPNMIPSEEVFTKKCRVLGINNESIIVVYDNLGIYTSPRAWWMFRVMGHKKVAVLNGGLDAWMKEDFPVESISEITNNKGNFKANYQPNLVKDSSFLVNNIKQKTHLVIDARSVDRYKGNVPEPRENMASGHIPNSLNLHFKNVLDNDGKMKSKNELLTIFQQFTIKNQPLIFTCGSGVTASILLLASEIALENNKSLYDGSWAEWGQLGKFPIEN